MILASRGHRWMARFFSFALSALLAGVAMPASAFDPVSDGGGEGGGCATNCPQPQTSYVTGTAVFGDAANNGSSSSFHLDYGIPYDSSSSLYSGTYMIQIVDGNNNVRTFTGPASDHATGGVSYFSFGGLPQIPTGGSASITINESNANGASFQAGYVVNGFGQ